MWYVTPAPQMLDFGWVWFNTGSPLWLNSGGFADFLNNGKPPNVHGFYWPTLLERLHISCSAANKIGLLHQGVQTTKCENKLSWWLQTCWWISWLKQIIIISSHALIVMVFFFFKSPQFIDLSVYLATEAPMTYYLSCLNSCFTENHIVGSRWMLLVTLPTSSNMF